MVIHCLFWPVNECFVCMLFVGWNHLFQHFNIFFCHKWEKVQKEVIIRQWPKHGQKHEYFGSTQLIIQNIFIIIQNIGIQLEVESHIGPLFDLLFYPDYWPNIEYFFNNEARSNYSPKFGDMCQSEVNLHENRSKTSLVIRWTDLPPPRKRPQNFSPSMEDLTHSGSVVPYSKLGKTASSRRFHRSENELVDDADEMGESPPRPSTGNKIITE